MFPDPETAADEDGLLAYGGDLSPSTLITAYSQGIFPWYSDGQPILWWSTDPRFVIDPANVRIPRSVKKNFNRYPFEIRFNTCFEQVIELCAERKDESGTWITDEMKQAYIDLHRLGWAHSAETFLDGELVGGLYGLALDRCFHGESMFSLAPDASKFALKELAAILAKNHFQIIDCQMHSEHLERMGAYPLSRRDYLSIIRLHGQAKAFRNI